MKEPRDLPEFMVSGHAIPITPDWDGASRAVYFDGCTPRVARKRAEGVWLDARLAIPEEVVEYDREFTKLYQISL